MIKGQTMLKTQKEQLSSLMDGDQCDVSFINTMTNDDELFKCWHRYHIVRDTIQDKLSECSLTFDITERVANAIALDDLFDQATTSQVPMIKNKNLYWIKIKDTISRLSQVGLAACVTLGIIAGVQYQQNSVNDNSMPILNTVPIGVNVSPVGGTSSEQQNYQLQKESMNQQLDQQEYNKIRLFIQDYELQKRLNVQ